MVSATMVKDLREKTGAGMMDCKKVLTETDGKSYRIIKRKRNCKSCKKI